LSSDLKVVQYLVGTSIMDPAAIANLTALYLPVTLFVWAALTHLFVTQFAGGWPTTANLFFTAGLFPAIEYAKENATGEVLAMLKLAPTMVTPPILLLALFELRHRNRFEEEMKRAVGEEDMRDIEGYYGTTSEALAKKKTGGRSGFWVLEFDGRIIGAFGLDGLKPGEGLDSAMDHPPPKIEGAAGKLIADDPSSTTDSPRVLRPRKSASALSTTTTPTPSSYTDTLHLRRFATSLSFRPTGIEDDLLAQAAKFAFSPSSSDSSPLPPASRIIISIRPSISFVFAKRLIKNGYQMVEQGKGHLEIKEVRSPAGWVDELADRVWPLDLSWRSYVLEKKVWEKRH
jgi:hypothetical protein